MSEGAAEVLAPWLRHDPTCSGGCGGEGCTHAQHTCECGLYLALARLAASPPPSQGVPEGVDDLLREAERILHPLMVDEALDGSYCPEPTASPIGEALSCVTAALTRLSASRPPTEGPEGRKPVKGEVIDHDGCIWRLERASVVMPNDRLYRLIPAPPEQPEEKK